MGAAEIPVDIRPIFKYQIYRILSTSLRPFPPFLLRFLRCRVDPLFPCRRPIRWRAANRDVIFGL